LEKDKKAHANLLKNFELLNSSPATGSVEILQTDCIEFLKRHAAQSANLIFIDPPFQESDLLNRAVLEAARVCDDTSGGGIYVEFPANRSLEELESLLPSWHCGKYLEAGQVKACLFRSGRG
jgi:16S rRNA G966 N2-methylase RsmD